GRKGRAQRGCEDNRRDRRERNSAAKQQAELDTVVAHNLTRREADGLQHSELAPPRHDSLHLQAGGPHRDKGNQESNEERSARPNLPLFLKCSLEVVALRQPAAKRSRRLSVPVFCQLSLFQE